MNKITGSYPRIKTDTGCVGAVGNAGGVLLTQTIKATGLDVALSQALAPWRKPTAFHDPAKVLLDLAISLALGGDCLADVALLRAEPELYGLVACDATVSRTISLLAQHANRVLRAVDTARATARLRAWALAGDQAPDHTVDTKTPLVIDVDATLLTAHSDKQGAAGTYKHTYGHHPLLAFVDHGPDGTGEPLAIMLRPGNAGSNTTTDHIKVINQALRQLPANQGKAQGRRSILIRTDGAGGSHKLVNWLTGKGLSYSVGFTLPAHASELLGIIDRADVWQPAYDAHDQIRDGAWVAELTGLLDLTGWPPTMRVIVRKERPHPGAQTGLFDHDGHRVTAFATNTTPGGPHVQLADLELRHRRRARCEDRIRCAKDTGLANLPLQGFDQNRIWCAIVTLAGELTAWMQLLALSAHQARRWEPKRLRLRLFAVPAVMASHARRQVLRISRRAPWAGLTAAAIKRLTGLISAPT